MFQKYIPTFSNGVMFRGDTSRKWLTYILKVLTAGFVLSPFMIVIESYRNVALLIVILHLVLHDDYNAWGLCLSVCVYNTDIAIWDYADQSQFIIYFLLYFVHHYLLYIALFSSFQLNAKAENLKSKELNQLTNGYIDQPGLAGFFKKYTNYISLFYCVDIPLGSLKVMDKDPVVISIQKYHIQVKMLISVATAFMLSKH